MTILHGESVTLRPVAPEDTAVLREILETPKVARWWGPPEHDAWPFEPDHDGHRFAVVHDGDVVGLAQYGEETTPAYRHADIDLFLDPRVHGHGLGADTVRALARHLFEDLDHHRVVIDPATANAAAVRCYEKVGFRRVGVMRRYELNHDSGTWRDGLLMDLLPEDLT
ncbi:MAG: GNAT family N-acetyltransferase [Actinomycetes bacterium]